MIRSEEMKKEIRCSKCIFHDTAAAECHRESISVPKDSTDWCGKFVDETGGVYWMFVPPADVPNASLEPF